MNRAAEGRAVEGVAERHLRSLGYGIVARNYRCRSGELDLVAQEGETLVFVEVRSRVSRAYGTPEDSIGPAKRRRLWRTAQHFLQRMRTVPACRFDVVAVEGGRGGEREVRVIRDAFRAEDVP